MKWDHSRHARFKFEMKQKPIGRFIPGSELGVPATILQSLTKDGTLNSRVAFKQPLELAKAEEKTLL